MERLISTTPLSSPNEVKIYKFIGDSKLEDSIELHNRLESRLNLLNLFYTLDILIGDKDMSVRMIIHEG